MKLTVLATLAVMIGSSIYPAPPVKLSDEKLREAIAGAWFSEELPQMMRHIAERMQYFPDGRFNRRLSHQHSQQRTLHSQHGNVAGKQRPILRSNREV